MEPTVRCVHVQQVLDPETVCGLLILCAFSSNSGCLSLLVLEWFILPWKPLKWSRMMKHFQFGAVHGWECGLGHYGTKVKFQKWSAWTIQRTKKCRLTSPPCHLLIHSFISLIHFLHSIIYFMDTFFGPLTCLTLNCGNMCGVWGWTPLSWRWGLDFIQFINLIVLVHCLANVKLIFIWWSSAEKEIRRKVCLISAPSHPSPKSEKGRKSYHNPEQRESAEAFWLESNVDAVDLNWMWE